MKLLKGFLLVLVSLAVIYFVLALVGPKNYEVKREKIIAIPKNIVWNQIVHLNNWENWSAWREMEVDAEYSYSEKSGEVGAYQSWKGDTVGQGKLTTEVVDFENGNFEYLLEFVEPFNMHSKGQITVEETDQGTKVSWYDRGDIGFFGRPFMMFMNLDQMLGKDFERGLNKLDSICQIVNKDMKSKMEVYEKTFMPKVYIGLRDTVSMAEAMTSEYYQKQFMKLGMFYGKNQWQISEPPVAITYEWNETDSIADLTLSFVSPGDIDLIGEKDFSIIKVDSSKAFIIDYYGSYDEVGKAHQVMGEYLKDNNIDMSKMKFVLEEYVTDPTTVSDPSEILTRIHYLFRLD